MKEQRHDWGRSCEWIGMRFEADSALVAGEGCHGDPQGCFRENLLPTVWPSGALKS